MTTTVPFQAATQNSVDLSIPDSNFTVELALVPIGAKGDVGDVNPLSLQAVVDAQAAATAAAGSATAAAADRTQTGLDKTATAADRVQTGLDAATATTKATIATTKASEAAASKDAADADAVATAADRVQTGLDKAATAADRVQTGLDKTATAADRVQTGLDKTATASDRAQTGLDKTATSADRVQTGLDAATATAKANIATTQAGIATTNAETATAQAVIAASKAGEALSSAVSAASAQAAAESARDSTLAAFDSFDDRYLGAKASDPAVDNDGNALASGALYYCTATGSEGMRVYTGSAWVAAYISGTGVLSAANNLSDLTNISTARLNLGLSTVAVTGSYTDLLNTPTIPTVPTTVSSFTNDAGYLTSYTETDPVFLASAAAGVTTAKISNWDNAYGWGNHASAGYETSAHSSSTYQTQSGMSSYLTTSSASSTYQPIDADLTAIAGLTGTSGLLKKTAANTWALDSNTYLTGITSGQVTTALGYTPYNSTNPNGYITSSGTAANVSGTVAIANGGTGATTASAALTALGAYAASNPNGYTTNTGTVTSIATSGAITGGTITSTGTITHSTADGYLHVPATGTTNSGKVLTAGATAGSLSWTTPATGTVTSVGMTVPTGLTVSGTPVTGSGTLAVTLTTGYSIPTTASQTNWDTAYTDRNKWDGGATGLVAATGRTSLGLGTAATMAGPTGTLVGTTDTQTLTNKTFTGYTETVYNLTGTDISPANGTIQYKTLGANTTFTESLADGQCVTLMLNPATYTVTWPTTTWVGSVASTAPTLVASVYNCITFFQIAGTLYGKYEGRV